MVLDTWPNTNEIIKANNHAGRNTASSHSAALSDNLEAALAAARPRLLRFARKRGIAPDAADDVVQETLIEAWRHLNHLRTPDRFEAWLTGICRNVCLRWSSAHRNPSSSLEQFPSIPGREMYGRPFVGTLPPTLAEDIADPQALDPAEELSRQDLATLLDRALGYLSPGTREVLELHYLSEFSQHETALRLGLTINALEVRLHRARRQLRQVLNNELRADAHTFGLPLDDDQDTVTGWRETRLWSGQQPD